MEHLRAMWREAAAPVRGMSLEDLFASTKPTLAIQAICKKNSTFGRNKGPYVAELSRNGFERKPNDLMSEIHKLEQSAKTRAEGGDTAKVIENMGGIDRIVLLGSGNNASTVLLAEKKAWGDPWRAPSKSFQGEYDSIEPMPSFYNHMSYGSKDELLKVFIVDVAGGVFDDSQFAGVDEGQTLTVYRGISLKPGQDPTSANKEGQGTGSSWTMDEEAAMAIAERGQAGFEGDNKLRNDVFRVRVRDMKTDAAEPGAGVPTVLRAEVVISASGASPYRPWSNKYVSEMEIDIPRGQEFTLTGWKQATAKPVSESEKRKAEEAYELSLKLERENKLDDPAWIDGRQAGYYVRWTWGPWKSVKVKRTAGGGKDLGVSWYAPGKKRPIGYTTRATGDLIVLLAEDGLTVSQAKDALIYDPEGRDVMQAFIDLGYGDTTLTELNVR